MKISNHWKIWLAFLPIVGSLGQGFEQQFFSRANINTAGLVFFAKLDGNGTDSSGQNNTVSFVGSPAFTGNVPATALAKYSALTLNGTSQYGVSANNLAITGSMTRTIAVWAWTTNAVMGDQVMVQCGGATSATDFEFDFNSSSLGGGTQSVYVGLAGGNKVWRYNYPDGKWHNYVVTYSGGTISNANLYVDAALISPFAVNSLTPNTSAGKIYIGASAGTPYFQGSLFGVMIYNRVLSAAEISAGTK